jgi:septal ring-binding cell division protein DamX
MLGLLPRRVVSTCSPLTFPTRFSLSRSFFAARILADPAAKTATTKKPVSASKVKKPAAAASKAKKVPAKKAAPKKKAIAKAKPAPKPKKKVEPKRTSASTSSSVHVHINLISSGRSQVQGGNGAAKAPG